VGLGGSGYAAVVLAGGPGKRMGHPAKATLPVGGIALLTRVLAAVADASPRIVVGPPHGLDLPADVLTTVEEPPGGGPVAAAVAGVALLDRVEPSGWVALLAADLPFITSGQLGSMMWLAHRDGHDGAVLVDDHGRPQWLCGVWRLRALTDRIAAMGDPTGRSMRWFTDGLAVRHLAALDVREGAPVHEGPPAWFDCDTRGDLRRAERWVHGNAG
jgi:molybdopterin-guanine dinucleotide biosynthesis protein A